jgi:predicted RNA binding protein with dsRBD fold (UPF0201 family)
MAAYRAIIKVVLQHTGGDAPPTEEDYMDKVEDAIGEYFEDVEIEVEPPDDEDEDVEATVFTINVDDVDVYEDVT